MKGKRTKLKDRTDWDKIAQMKDEDIDTSDIPPLGPDFFKNAVLRLPVPKELVSIRLDADVLAWYRKQGKGYQTRINEVLKMYMRAQAA
jgi:uncharacterized protein (DUF4415 family)